MLIAERQEPIDGASAISAKLKTEDYRLSRPSLHDRNLAIMQEKLHKAEAAAARAEKVRSDESQREARVASLEIELQAWRESASDLGCDSHEGLAGKLAELQNEFLLVSKRFGSSEAERRELTGKHAKIIS